MYLRGLRTGLVVQSSQSHASASYGVAGHGDARTRALSSTLLAAHDEAVETAKLAEVDSATGPGRADGGVERGRLASPGAGSPVSL